MATGAGLALGLVAAASRGGSVTAAPEPPSRVLLQAAGESAAPLPAPLIQPLDPTHARPTPSTLAVLPRGWSDQLPAAAARAYMAAAGRAGCAVPPALLAGIGLIESGHARGHGSEAVSWDGTARPPVLGPELTGGTFAAVPDTDGGALDGDSQWDRAVGPMQFLPSTWSRWGVDADGDGRRDPQDIADAAAAAAAYLCADGRDLRRPADLAAAVFSYNHSADYVRAVLTAAARYGVDRAFVTRALTLVPDQAPASPRPTSPAAATPRSTSPPASTADSHPRASAAPTPVPDATPAAPTAPTAPTADPVDGSASPASSPA